MRPSTITPSQKPQQVLIAAINHIKSTNETHRFHSIENDYQTSKCLSLNLSRLSALRTINVFNWSALYYTSQHLRCGWCNDIIFYIVSSIASAKVILEWMRDHMLKNFNFVDSVYVYYWYIFELTWGFVNVIN